MQTDFNEEDGLIKNLIVVISTGLVSKTREFRKVEILNLYKYEKRYFCGKKGAKGSRPGYRIP